MFNAVDDTEQRKLNLHKSDNTNLKSRLLTGLTTKKNNIKVQDKVAVLKIMPNI